MIMEYYKIIKELPDEVQTIAKTGLVRIFLFKGRCSHCIVMGCQSGSLVKVKNNGTQEFITYNPDWEKYEELYIPVIEIGTKDNETSNL